MDLAIKNILEELVEGNISIEEAWKLIKLDENSINREESSKPLTNNTQNILTIRMF